MRPLTSEALLSVSLLNLDATSMNQIAAEAAGDHQLIATRILEIVRQRGKMHNPATNSGGVLVGRVERIGGDFRGARLEVGDTICPIVSLSLLPLQLSAVHKVDTERHQVEVEGQAIIFSSTTFGVIPDDMPLTMAVGLIDIAGAPARTLRMVRPGMKVAILGAGKAGLLCAAAARKQLGGSGRLLVVDASPAACEAASALGLADEVSVLDLTDPIGAHRFATTASGGDLYDVVISVTSAPGTEGAAILCCRDGGRVLFFGMATSFQTAALSAEGAGKDVELLIGNGYVPDCVEDTFQLVRSNPKLGTLLRERFR